jgi:GT2 family glycosyltransferase
MESDRLAAQLSAEPDDELLRLVVSFKAARLDGKTAQALRSIDRARRIAPDRPEINHLYGQALMADAPAAALPYLEKAVALQPSVTFEAAVIGALLADHDLERAAERLAKALGAYAVTPGGPLAKLARRVTEELAPRWPGWIGVAPDLRLCGDIIGCAGPELLSLREQVDGAHRDHMINPGPGAVAPFLVRLKQIAARRVIEAAARGETLLGGPVAFPPEFHLDGRATLTDGTLTGWVSIGWTTTDAIQVMIAGRDGFRLQIGTVPDILDPVRHRFSVGRETCADAGNRLVFSAMLPDGSFARLPDSPLLIDAPPAPRGRGRRLSADGGADRTDRSAGAAATPPDAPVDIVIPVYKGVEETLACIRSVIATAPGSEIVVIDDASPDPEMAPALEPLAAAGKITLLRNPRNLGFPRTVNRGFGLHPDRDLVVLNADTEVFGDWLERLREAAYRSPDIASVTPLTNSGSIASYPKSEDDCPRDRALALDRLARAANGGQSIDIPTGVGFCLYVRRECLAQTGFFDTIAFGHGYGEENDLCLRAAAQGWRHVLAPNVFVRHVGSRSFGVRRKALFERNNRLINLRYPGYDAKIQSYLQLDPVHQARRRLDEARLLRPEHAGEGRPYILLVTLALEGGVRRAVNERAAFWRDKGVTAITLKPDAADPNGCVLSVDGENFEDLSYRLPDDRAALLGLLRRLSIESVELHHFLGLTPDLIDGVLGLGLPVDVWVHDYVWYCPRITLLGGDNAYCGEPVVSVCETCVTENGATLDRFETVAALRERSQRWLSQARTVVAPSAALAQRLRAKFPGLPVRVEALEEVSGSVAVSYTPKEVLKVAIIGAIGIQKGYAVLADMVRDAAARDLPIEFIVIGYTKDDNALRAGGNVFVTGQYNEAEIEALIARENPAIALFLSVFPETWCYALTHAFKAGLPVAAFDFGAIAERLRAGGGAGILFPLASTAGELNDGLLKAFPVLPRPRAALVPVRAPSEGERADAHAAALPVATAASAADNLVRRGQGSRNGMVQNLSQLTASVEVLPLVKGLYLFSVGATESRKVGDDHELVLPALQVGLGPGTPPDHVEFMFGPRTEAPWLCEPRDHIVVKVKATSTILLLTSVRAQGMAPLEIDVKRLDGPQAVKAAAQAQPKPKPAQQQANPAPRPALALPAQRKPPAAPAVDKTEPSIPLRVTVHVQRRGDMVFNEGQWAGVSGQRLSVESFSIQPLDEANTDLIEYKAVTASGIETPWVASGALCGTRGMGMPLVGFAVRIKPQAADQDYICEYSAVMISGATLGPARNGAPCRSVDIGDPIEAIWISVRKAQGGAQAGDRPPAQLAAGRASKQKAVASGNAADAKPEPALAGGSAGEPPKPRPPLGPRFSVFRDPVE